MLDKLRDRFLFWVMVVMGSDEIMEKAADHNDSALLFHRVVGGTPKNCPSRLENTESPFYHITGLGVFHVKVLSRILGC